MKKLLRMKSMLAVALLLVCFGQKARASHFQGSDLTYTCVAPGTYYVSLKLYRDCSGSTAPSSATLNLRPQGCGSPRTVSMTKTPGSNAIGNLYCPQLGAPQCSSSGKPNYETVTFTSLVTFSATERNCPDWYLSWSECCRPSTANLVGQDDPFAEAYINLGPAASPFNNNSPDFDPLNIPIPLVCVNQDIVYSLNALEVDGDSLSYELMQPLSAANTVVPYQQIGAGGTNIIINQSPRPPYNTTTNQQFAILQGGQATYSATYPIPSFIAPWNTPDPATGIPPKIVTAVPYFNLDPISGQLRFNPSVYVAGTQSSAGKNKYAVVVRINEWRKVNGAMVKVGYIRRDMLFIVEDCSGNVPPQTTVPPIPPKFEVELNDTLVKVQTCNTTRIVYKFQDTDKITITVDTAKIRRDLPNGSMRIYKNGTPNVEAVLMITPEASHAGHTYLIPIRIEDDACPIKSIANPVYRIEVRRQSLAKVIGNETREICLGETSKLDVNLSRPDSILGKEATYSYQWSLHPSTPNGDGLPANRSQRDITVKPTKTTRYLLKATNTLSALKGACYDTTSVLVKVNENPIISSITVGYPQGREDIIFGRDAMINVVIDNVDQTGYTYKWSPGSKMLASNGRPDSTIMADLLDPSNDSVSSTVLNPKVISLKTRTYKLTVTSPSGCESSKEVEVKVGAFFLPNIITPNNDGKNDKFVYKGIEPNTSLQIFNRWGVKVKDYKSYDNSFGGEGISDGVYYYILKEPKGGKTFKGYFEIVRD
ncbi:gliding motility-associated C-terminal domain-containing protein [Adhaeribacter soli]|uniref:Gliding motility-associated C-terminal domain-containing protein n=1 Tax=Adhaeribacter soli TaxID=2607655 RepID=A0A5N1J1A4_9BACT|nr:gliding motility-associated C-terminal domain-containing protein [Adhaeribacter soli]KAA9340563.1 gliding motility-associated C-terminal domain-containing protein [Adhaeribacter soli]